MGITLYIREASEDTQTIKMLYIKQNNIFAFKNFIIAVPRLTLACSCMLLNQQTVELIHCVPIHKAPKLLGCL